MRYVNNGLILDAETLPPGSETIREAVVRLLSRPNKQTADDGGYAVSDETGLTLIVDVAYSATLGDENEYLETTYVSSLRDSAGREIDLTETDEFDDMEVLEGPY